MSSVLSLYRRLLRLHQRLPKELAEFGVIYVQSEFKRHRELTDQLKINEFINEWKKFSVSLERQLSSDKTKLGHNLQDMVREGLSEQQWGQLAELHQETTKYQ